MWLLSMRASCGVKVYVDQSSRKRDVEAVAVRLMVSITSVSKR